MKKISNKPFLGILVFLVCLNLIAWVGIYEISASKFLEVNFFNVGQGDAIFIQTPERRQILIDGGPGSIILEKLAKEMPFWDRSIDLVILTHPEHDHIAGLIEVLKRYEVEHILWTGVLRSTAEFKEWQNLVEKENARIKIAQAGQRIIDSGSWEIKVLYPFENLNGKTVKSVNNTSVVVRLVFGNNSFLFTGDAFKSVEKKLISKGEDLDSDILKVGHHGSKTSSKEEFIEKVSPEIAVIQAGEDNPYGHPNQEVLAILQNFGINVFRTDLNGDIKIISDGNNLKIQSSNVKSQINVK